MSMLVCALSSWYHFSKTLESELGFTTENAIKNTSVFGYERGRNRS